MYLFMIVGMLLLDETSVLRFDMYWLWEGCEA